MTQAFPHPHHSPFSFLFLDPPAVSCDPPPARPSWSCAQRRRYEPTDETATYLYLQCLSLTEKLKFQMWPSPRLCVILFLRGYV